MLVESLRRWKFRYLPPDLPMAYRSPCHQWDRIGSRSLRICLLETCQNSHPRLRSVFWTRNLR